MSQPPNVPETSGEASNRAPAEPFVSLQLLPLSIVVEGSLVTLECEFTLPDSVVPAATPDDNVQWSFESSNEELPETLLSTSSEVEGALVRSKLVIEHVQPTHQGIYSCKLRANSATSSGETTPTVTSTLLLVRSAATATGASSSIRAGSTKRSNITESKEPSNASKRKCVNSAHKFQHSAGQSSSQWRSQALCDFFALRLDSGTSPTLELISQSEPTARGMCAWRWPTGTGGLQRHPEDELRAAHIFLSQRCRRRHIGNKRFREDLPQKGPHNQRLTGRV